MSDFPIHSVETAPQEATHPLQQAKDSLGFVPNLFGTFAESPAALKAYLSLTDLVENQTAFSPTEAQVVLLSVSAVNGCEYCVAAHTGIAKAQKVPDDVVSAIRDGRPIEDEKLEALRTFTRSVVDNRGWVDQSDLRAFLDAGYTQRHVLEVILGVAMKTLSNYTNHIAAPALDKQFEAAKWTKPETAGV